MRLAPDEYQGNDAYFIMENEDAQLQVVCRRLKTAEYRMWKKESQSPSQDTRDLALERVAEKCVVWPTWDEFFSQYLEKGFPVLADMAGEFIIKKSGGQAFLAQKKSTTK